MTPAGMIAIGQISNLVRWDLLRELRRKETLLNMSLFAVLILFCGHIGIEVFAGYFVDDLGATPAERGPALQEAKQSLGPIFFWIAALFAGTVGLNQSFVREREGTSLGGIVSAPIDPGVFFLAKVISTWLYVMTMQVVLFLAYIIFFNYDNMVGKTWTTILPAVACFTLAYVAPGTILAAMTTTLGGAGEVVLRILLFVLMLPLIMLTLQVSAQLFGVDDSPLSGSVLGLGNFSIQHYFGVALAFSAIYLCAGYLLFPRILQD